LTAKRPLTVPQILARRRNARRSTGPRTEEGRRRAKLNYRSLELPEAARRRLERLHADPRDFQRVWRDVLAVFAFMGPEMEPCLSAVAWDFWLKQHCALHAFQHMDLLAIEARLDKSLMALLHVYKLSNRKWRFCLRREFGPFLEGGPGLFRKAVELRLESNQRLASQGKFPQQYQSVLEAAVAEVADVLIDSAFDEFGLQDPA